MQVLISGWKFPRHAFVHDGCLCVEVARSACSHCPTCAKRAHFVEEQLNKSGVDWEWVYTKGGIYFSVPAPGECVHFGDHLTSLLKLPTRFK